MGAVGKTGWVRLYQWRENMGEKVEIVPFEPTEIRQSVVRFPSVSYCSISITSVSRPENVLVDIPVAEAQEGDRQPPQASRKRSHRLAGRVRSTSPSSSPPAASGCSTPP